MAAGERTRDAVSPVSRQLRALYVAHRRLWDRSTQGTESRWGQQCVPKWDGGLDPKTGQAHHSTWDRAAVLCLEYGLNPAHHVAALFAGWSQVRTAPLPNQLCGASAVTRTQTYQASACPSVDAERVTAWRHYALRTLAAEADGVPPEVAARRLLRDPAAGLSALARYCLADQVGDADLMRQVRDVAALQYLCRRAEYDAAWGDRIPADLRAEVAAAEAALAGRTGDDAHD